jgi:cyclase
MKIILLALTSLSLFAQQDFSKVQIKPEKVRDNIHMLNGSGGNIGLFKTEKGWLMIDDQFAPLHDKIMAAIAKIGEGPVEFLINTHWHFDHTGGNELLGKKGSIIVAHENVRKVMSKDQVIKAFNRQIPAASKEALPIITFTKDMKFHLNNEEIQVFHSENAHTNGDSIIHFKKANVFHVGDTFFNGIYPFIDTDRHGSVTGMINSADRVLKLMNKDTLIIPGHGPLAKPKDLRKFRDMLKEVRSALKPYAKKKTPLKEVIAADPLKKLNEKWGKGFLKPGIFIGIVYPNHL